MVSAIAIGFSICAGRFSCFYTRHNTLDNVGELLKLLYLESKELDYRASTVFIPPKPYNKHTVVSSTSKMV